MTPFRAPRKEAAPGREGRVFTKTNLPTIRLSQAKPPSSNFHAHDLNPRNPTKDGSPKSPLRNSRADLLISRAPQTLGLRTGRPELKPRYRSFRVGVFFSLEKTPLSSHLLNNGSPQSISGIISTHWHSQPSQPSPAQPKPQPAQVFVRIW